MWNAGRVWTVVPMLMPMFVCTTQVFKITFGNKTEKSMAHSTAQNGPFKCLIQYEQITDSENSVKLSEPYVCYSQLIFLKF